MYDIEGYEEFKTLSKPDQLESEFGSCVEWDAKYGFIYGGVNNFLVKIEELEELGEGDEYVTVFNAALEVTNPTAQWAASLPIECAVIRQNWPDKFADQKWFRSFILFRGNGGLKHPMNRTRIGSWIPVTRDLSALKTVPNIVFKRGHLKSDEYISDCKEFQEAVELANSGETQMTFVHAVMNSGKTGGILEFYDPILRPHIRVVTPHVILSGNIAEAVNVPTHKGLTVSKQKSANSITTTLHSLPNLNPLPKGDRGVLVFDEYTGTFDTLFLRGVGLDGHREIILQHLIRHVASGENHTLFLDADSNPEAAYFIMKSVNTVRAKHGLPPFKATYLRVTKDLPEVGYTVYTGCKKGHVYYEQLDELLAAGNKVQFFVNNVEEVKTARDRFEAQGYKVGIIHSQEMPRQQDADFKREFSRDPMAACIDFGIDVLIHTSSVKQGVSLNKPYFDACVLMECANISGSTSADITQIAGRIRQPVPRYIYLSDDSDKSTELGFNWTGDANGLMDRGFEPLEKITELLKSSPNLNGMFEVDFFTGKLVIKRTGLEFPVYKGVIANHYRRDRRGLAFSLREQLEYCGYNVQYVECPYESQKLSSNTTRKELIESVIALPTLTSEPTTDDPVHLMKWRAQQAFGVNTTLNKKLVGMIESEYFSSEKFERYSYLRGLIDPLKRKRLELEMVNHGRLGMFEDQVSLTKELTLIHFISDELHDLLHGAKIGDELDKGKMKTLRNRFRDADVLKATREIKHDFWKGEKGQLRTNYVLSLIMKIFGVKISRTGLKVEAQSSSGSFDSPVV